MADLAQLERALVKADAAGDADAARTFAAEIKRMRAAPAPKAAPKSSYFSDRLTEAKDAIGGIALGVSDIGNTVLNAVSPVTELIPGVAQANRTRNADFEAITEQKKNSKSFGGGRLVGNIAATLPVGGALGGGLRAGAPLLARAGVSAPVVEGVANALATSGFKAGALTGAAKVGARVAGGAITGGLSAGLIDPESAGTGALIGGALPLAAPVARYVGRGAKSVVEPFTESGREVMAGRIINRFAEGGPTTVNAAEIVPGSMPTLAEATKNAGIAGLQRGTRDVKPNAFVEREAMNAGARNALFDNVAGNRLAIDAADAARSQTGNRLYGDAFSADAARQAAADASVAARKAFTGAGVSATRDDLGTPGLRELMSRPAFKKAAKDAQLLAENNNIDLGDPLQSLQGLHYIKLALDDALNPTAKSAMGRNASNAIMDMRDKLADELAKVSPLYGTARNQFAADSLPINSMEALQGLRITDAKGNITLSKVKNAIEGLERQRNAPGVSDAKAVTQKQLAALNSIYDDLLRQTETAAGRSAGSNTFQNLATDNILANILPGKTGNLINGRIGDVVGQVGRLAYSGPNEKIRNRLAEMMLDPAAAEAAMLRAGAPRVTNPLAERFGQEIFRIAPTLPATR